MKYAKTTVNVKYEKHTSFLILGSFIINIAIIISSIIIKWLRKTSVDTRRLKKIKN